MASTVVKDSHRTKTATSATLADIQDTMDQYAVNIDKAIIVYTGTAYVLFWQ